MGKVVSVIGIDISKKRFQLHGTTAGAALSRAGFCGLPRSGRGPPGIRSAPEPAASGRGPDHLGLQHRSVQRNQPPGRRSRRRVFFI